MSTQNVKPGMLAKVQANELRTTVSQIRALLLTSAPGEFHEKPGTPNRLSTDKRTALLRQRAKIVAMREQLAKVRARCQDQRRQLTALQERLANQRVVHERHQEERAARGYTPPSGQTAEHNIDSLRWAVEVRQQQVASLRKAAEEKRKIASEIADLIERLGSDNHDQATNEHLRLANERHRLADERESLTCERERLADARERLLDARERRTCDPR